MRTDDSVRYREAHLPPPRDPLLTVAQLARSGRFDQYLVYESDQAWHFAGGSLACLRLSRDWAVQQVGGHTRRVPCTGNPLGVVERFLATTGVAGWRAYGWAAFEMAQLLAGAGDQVGDADLLHLVVPQTEVRITAEGMVVRSTDPQLLDSLTQSLREEHPVPVHTADPDVAVDAVDVAVEDSRNYRAAVAAAVLDIRAGLLEKVIISRVVEVGAAVDLVGSYVAGRRNNTPARSFLLDLGRMRAAGFSPETVVVVSPDGQVTTQPLAGTRARTGSPARDRQLCAELLADPKEIYEHAVSVKLAWDEVAAVCEPDSVGIGEFMAVRERGSVQHLASTVSGRLPVHGRMWTAFAALFPAVTATGIPKRPAYELIRQLEGRERGLYAGAVMVCDSEGSMDAALVLRSIFQEGDRTWLQAGAGIVGQSLPEREHEETCEKLRSVARCLVSARTPQSLPTG